MADNIMEQPHRYQLIQQHHQQMRQQRIEAERRAAYQQQQQQQQQRQQQQAAVAARSDSFYNGGDPNWRHNHTPDQPDGGGRSGGGAELQRAPRPSDRLFQSFHREPSAQDNNGERSPPVINVDLESEQMNKNLTVKELTDTVISHDFGARQQQGFYHMQDTIGEQWKRRMQQKDNKQQQQDERQIIRMAQPQKYMEPASPSENNHWSEHNFRRYQQPQSHISALDYVKNKIVEVMRTEDDKKEAPEATHATEKDRSDSPGEMVIDEEKHEGEFGGSKCSRVVIRFHTSRTKTTVLPMTVRGMRNRNLCCRNNMNRCLTRISDCLFNRVFYLGGFFLSVWRILTSVFSPD